MKIGDRLTGVLFWAASGSDETQEGRDGDGTPGGRQQELWIATGALASVPQHVFYDKLNELLDEAGFDRFAEELCEPFYAQTGRDSIPPGCYFCMPFVGYFEELDAQRGRLQWRPVEGRA